MLVSGFVLTLVGPLNDRRFLVSPQTTTAAGKQAPKGGDVALKGEPDRWAQQADVGGGGDDDWRPSVPGGVERRVAGRSRPRGRAGARAPGAQEFPQQEAG